MEFLAWMAHPDSCRLHRFERLDTSLDARTRDCAGQNMRGKWDKLCLLCYHTRSPYIATIPLPAKWNHGLWAVRGDFPRQLLSVGRDRFAFMVQVAEGIERVKEGRRHGSEGRRRWEWPVHHVRRLSRVRDMTMIGVATLPPRVRGLVCPCHREMRHSPQCLHIVSMSMGRGLKGANTNHQSRDAIVSEVPLHLPAPRIHDRRTMSIVGWRVGTGQIATRRAFHKFYGGNERYCECLRSGGVEAPTRLRIVELIWSDLFNAAEV